MRWLTRRCITQEMLAKGYLAGNSVYVCTEHTPGVVDGYFEALDPVFGLIRRMRRRARCDEPAQGAGLSCRLQAAELNR